MNNYDYPPGSDTPSAPWNLTDPGLEECPDCDGTGVEIYDIDDEEMASACSRCDGTGQIEVEPD